MIALLFSLPLICTNMTPGNDTACFELNEFAEYCGTLLDLKDTGKTLQLTLEVNETTWESVDLLMMFNLAWDKRNAGTISGTKPVQIVMTLDKSLYKTLKESGNLVTDSAAFSALGKGHPMRGTEAWFATEVTEEVDLPEELKSLGSLREGFTTHWKQDN